MEDNNDNQLEDNKNVIKDQSKKSDFDYCQHFTDFFR
jgi:hypothetical protein